MSSIAETVDGIAAAGQSRVLRSGYIASPRFDALFFLLSPILALAAAELLTPLHWPFEKTRGRREIRRGDRPKLPNPTALIGDRAGEATRCHFKG